MPPASTPLAGIAPGTYTVLSTLGPHSLRRPAWSSPPERDDELRTAVDWPPSIFESVAVNGTTRLPARLVDAPAAVTVIGGDEIAYAGTARAAAAGAGGNAGSGGRPERSVRLQPQ